MSFTLQWYVWKSAPKFSKGLFSDRKTTATNWMHSSVIKHEERSIKDCYFFYSFPKSNFGAFWRLISLRHFRLILKFYRFYAVKCVLSTFILCKFHIKKDITRLLMIRKFHIKKDSARLLMILLWLIKCIWASCLLFRLISQLWQSYVLIS